MYLPLDRLVERASSGFPRVQQASEGADESNAQQEPVRDVQRGRRSR
jgi:hypothetical protein